MQKIERGAVPIKSAPYSTDPTIRVAVFSYPVRWPNCDSPRLTNFGFRNIFGSRTLHSEIPLRSEASRDISCYEALAQIALVWLMGQVSPSLSRPFVFIPGVTILGQRPRRTVFSRQPGHWLHSLNVWL